MSNFENDYKKLLRTILVKGEANENRTGVNTIKLFNQTFNVDLSEGFPIITGKKIFFDKGLHEFKWIYEGKTDLEFLHEGKIMWWDA